MLSYVTSDVTYIVVLLLTFCDRCPVLFIALFVVEGRRFLRMVEVRSLKIAIPWRIDEGATEV